MKAFTFTQYGNPEEVLRISELDRPPVLKNEVLIQVMATSINDFDWSMVSGRPLVYRLFFGLRKPRHQTPGMEASGVVVETGDEVTDFQIGDRVFGDLSDDKCRSFAQFLAVGEKAVRKIPQELNYIEAAAIPHAGLLAYQGLLQKAKLKKGERVLINGAGGGVGTLAFHLAKMEGCEVTGVDHGSKLSGMKSMGFDSVVDYEKQDFTKMKEQYDVILDCKTTHSAHEYMSVLKRLGRYVTIGGKVNKLLNVLFWGGLISKFSKKNISVLGLKPNRDLEKLTEILTSNNIKPLIDGPYLFEDLPHQISRFGRAVHKGKIVITVDHE